METKMTKQMEEARTSMFSRVFIGKNALNALGVLVVVTVVGAVLFWWLFMTFVDKHELGYIFNRFSGEIEAVEHSGWIIRPPIKYSVDKIDLRPYQVSITVNLSVSKRMLNAKLVRFNPDGLDTFISWHGRGAGSSISELKEILKCYAFDKANGGDCPFLTVVSELSPNQASIIEQGD